MSLLCANIKFHGYLIVVFSALLTTTVLISSATLKLLHGGTAKEETEEVGVPSDLHDLIDYGWFDFTGDTVHLMSVGVLYYGIRKENRYCLIPFLVSIVFDWIAYLVANTRAGSALPYQVWLVTTALFLYVFVILIGLYRLFQLKANGGALDRAEHTPDKTICL